jgi:hypothetical protein
MIQKSSTLLEVDQDFLLASSSSQSIVRQTQVSESGLSRSQFPSVARSGAGLLRSISQPNPAIASCVGLQLSPISACSSASSGVHRVWPDRPEANLLNGEPFHKASI